MSKRSACLILILAMYLGGAGRVYSENQKELLDTEGVVAVTTDTSETSRRRDEKKKYVGEVKNKDSKKRYVGDAESDQVENRKRRGTEKRYVGENGEEEFFKAQKAGTYKYDFEKEHDPEEQLTDARVEFGEGANVEVSQEVETMKEAQPGLPELERGKRAEIPQVEVYSDEEDEQ